MLKTLTDIKSNLTKKVITEHEIKECLYLINEELRNKPNPNTIYEVARRISCKTQFVEWYYTNVLKKER